MIGNSTSSNHRSSNPRSLFGAIGLVGLVATGCADKNDIFTVTDPYVDFDVWSDSDGDGYGAGDPIEGLRYSEVFDDEDCQRTSSLSDTALEEGCDEDDYDLTTIRPGFALQDGDCNDSDSTINPDAEEVCDGDDNDCNGLEDEADPNLVDGYSMQPDTDGDGYGDPEPSLTIITCDPTEEGYTTNDTDCNDADATVYPDAPELCDGLDNDCDSSVDETVLTDDPITDPADGNTRYLDADNDGYGDPDNYRRFCPTASATGYVSNGIDCNDSDSSSNPDTQDPYHRDPDTDGLYGCKDGTPYEFVGDEGDAEDMFNAWALLDLSSYVILDNVEAGDGNWSYSSPTWVGETNGVANAYLAPDAGIVGDSFSVSVMMQMQNDTEAEKPNYAGIVLGDILDEQYYGTQEMAIMVLWGNPLGLHDWSDGTFISVYECWEGTCSTVATYYASASNIVAGAGEWTQMDVIIDGSDISVDMTMDINGSTTTVNALSYEALSAHPDAWTTGVVSVDAENNGVSFKEFAIGL